MKTTSKFLIQQASLFTGLMSIVNIFGDFNYCEFDSSEYSDVKALANDWTAVVNDMKIVLEAEDKSLRLIDHEFTV